MSNVSRVINDIKELLKLAHKVRTLIVVDRAKSILHMPINAKDLNIDFLAFSGRRIFGSTEIGVLYVSK